MLVGATGLQNHYYYQNHDHDDGGDDYNRYHALLVGATGLQNNDDDWDMLMVQMTGLNHHHYGDDFMEFKIIWGEMMII